MIRFKEFSVVFKDSGFRERELKEFYYSIRKSVTLLHLGKRAWSELIKLEERCQWPVLRKIGDPALPIYRDADKDLLDKFLRTIAEEKDMREHKSSTDKVNYWTRLQSLIEERTHLLMQIFGFCEEDVEHCEMVAERYMRLLERRARDKKRMWKIGIGIGAGTATLAGAAALWYISKKDRK
ncbi:MAG TPA: hypothetical protein VMH06_06295 [Thermodesulfovibrionales bacterium]|nr:hypothetical protein [Thermodesulfovibrionales bacterium]